MMIDQDEHYYTEGYDESVDPYVMDNGVLINLLGLSDTQSLNEIEADLSQLQIQQILLAPSPSSFDAAYLCGLHRYIFSLIYPWAGEFRHVGIGKGDTIFLAPHYIPLALDQLFADLAINQSSLQGDPARFSEYVGHLLVQLNYIHPFREGNGRTQRLFISKLAQFSHLDLGWQAVSNDAMRRACIEGTEGNPPAMTRLLLLNIKVG